jgi:AcrR family transcriptional regulator
MPKVVNPEHQRALIRGAAMRIFASRGVQSAGLVHVARLAGIGRASIYYYYRDKDALVRDLIRELLAEEERLVATALGGAGTPLERIEHLAGELAELFGAWAALGRMLFELWSTAAGMFRPFFRRIRRDLAALIAQGQRSGEIDRELEPGVAAAAVIGLIDGMLLQRMVDSAAFADPNATRLRVVRTVQKILTPSSVVVATPSRTDMRAGGNGIHDL